MWEYDFSPLAFSCYTLVFLTYCTINQVKPQLKLCRASDEMYFSSLIKWPCYNKGQKMGQAQLGDQVAHPPKL